MPIAPQHFVVPFDGSGASRRALDFLAGYRGERERIVPVLLNVQQRPVYFWPEAALASPKIEATLLEEGERELEAGAALLRNAGFAPRSEVRLGFPADEILRVAQETQAAGVVMGTRGRGRFTSLALGSVATRVVHGAHQPTFLVREDARLPAELGRRMRVLVPVDGSEHSNRAVTKLAEWSEWLGIVEVELLYVQEAMTVLETMVPPHDDLLEQWSGADRGAGKAREILARAGIAHTLSTEVGEPALIIERRIGVYGAELVFMGTRGRGAAHHAFVGSVALNVVSASPVPVVLVA
jgi:nucleotide-binding universal stress UspA family protein